MGNARLFQRELDRPVCCNRTFQRGLEGWKGKLGSWGRAVSKPGGVAWSQLSSSWVTVEDFDQGNMDQREILERFIQSRGWKLVAHRLNPDGMYVLSHILL